MFGEMRVAKALSCALYAHTVDDTQKEQVGHGEQEWEGSRCVHDMVVGLLAEEVTEHSFGCGHRVKSVCYQWGLSKQRPLQLGLILRVEEHVGSHYLLLSSPHLV